MKSSKSSFPPAWRILCLTAAVLLTQAACTTYDAPVMSESEYAAAKAAMLARPRKIMHNNDGSDVVYFKKKDRPVTVQKFLDLRTSYTAGTVDTIIYSPISSGFAQFTVELPGCSWLTADPPLRKAPPIPENERVYINIAKELKELGTDALQAVIEFGHAHNQEVFFGFRTNDTHDFHYHPEYDNKFFSEWKDVHRHCLFGEDHTQNNIVHGSWSSVDFAHPEARQKQIDMVQAVVDKYDIDGIEFDFSRYLPMFKRVAAGDEANQAERDQLTGMYREIRRIVDRKGRERGRPILISMQLPDSVGYCRAIGIDLEVWLEEGLLDIMALPDSFRLNTYADGAALAHKYGRLYYAQLGYPSPFERREENSTLMSRLQAPSYYARALNALESGADGLLYANITERGGVRNLMKSDVEWLKKQDKRYFITDIGWDNIEGALASGERYNNLPQIMWRPRPRFITPGVAQEFILEIGDDLEALAAAGKYPEVTALVDL
ncbi:MAG: family 10 glycosylhydrolase, partial [Oligosphaeraceae bacterium]|nr:family 10 glycosylhydrolase [Oligosphaeraceae bacterium]